MAKSIELLKASEAKVALASKTPGTPLPPDP